MIEIKSLTKIYTSGKRPSVVALDNVSLKLPDTGLVFILGKSGCGKTTFLNLLGGLDRASSGEIIVDGKSTKDFKNSDYDKYRNGYVGYVFQDYNLIDHYTVGQNVALALELQGTKPEANEIENAFKQLGLVDENGVPLTSRKTNELSGGQKQRVAIARALVKKPKMILADEPTGALDSTTSTALYEQLKTLSKDILTVVVTHDEENALKYGDRIIRLKDGKIDSDVGDMQTSDKVEKSNSTRKCKNKLLFRRVLSMGLNGLRYKKIRLALSIFLSVIAFTALGFSVTATTCNVFDAELNTCYVKGEKTVFLYGQKNERDDYTYNNKYTESYNLVHDYLRLTKKQIAVLAENGTVMPVLDRRLIGHDDALNKLFSNDFLDVEYVDVNNPSYMSSYILDKEKYPYNIYYYYATNPITTAVELNPETGESDALLTPDSRLTVPCRLPRNNDEVAITNYVADVIMHYGLKEDGLAVAIEKPDDIIGRKIAGLTVCGIYETDEEDERVKFQEEYDVDDHSAWSEYSSMPSATPYHEYWWNGNHIMRSAFVAQGFHEKFPMLANDFEEYPVLYKMRGNVAKDKELLNKLVYSEESEPTDTGLFVIKTTTTFCTMLSSRYSMFAEKATMFQSEMFVDAMTYVGIGLAIFSALLLMNFMSISFEARTREIGVLRALGAKRSDVVKICLTQSYVVATINLVISLILLEVACIVANLFCDFWVFVIGLPAILTLVPIDLGIATLSALLPTIKTARKKPIEIINKIA